MRVPLIIVLLSAYLISCVSDAENDQIRLNREIEEIDRYIQNNPINSVKELTETGNGLRILWTEVSNSGVKPDIGDTVVSDYIGRLLNNVVFDTSIDSVAREHNLFNPNRTYEPLEFKLGFDPIFTGYQLGILNMEVGDKAWVFMPSIFGLGREAQGRIPANSPLIFEIDFIEIRKQTE